MTLKPWHLAVVGFMALVELVQAVDAARNLLGLF